MRYAELAFAQSEPSRTAFRTRRRASRSFVTLDRDLLLPAVAQRQHRERGGQFRQVLQERAVAVGPGPVLLLPLLQLVEQFLPPVVLDALRVGERILAQRVHRLGEGVVVVVKPRVLLPGVLG